jgi:hypothetical protein
MDGPRLLFLLAVVIVAAAVGGCGEDEERFSDKQIVDALGLEEIDGTYAIDGDPFCEVSEQLLNDASEVDEAGDTEQLVLTSAEGNVGIEAVAPFACEREARRALSKLDPKPKEE